MRKLTEEELNSLYCKLSDFREVAPDSEAAPGGRLRASAGFEDDLIDPGSWWTLVCYRECNGRSEDLYITAGGAGAATAAYTRERASRTDSWGQWWQRTH